MKRTIIITLVAWLFVRSGGLDALFALFFAGIVPGTQLVIPAGLMLTIYLAAGALLLHHVMFYGKDIAPKPAKR